MPAIAAALVLMLGIGIAMAITAINGSSRWGVSDWLTENRSHGSESTVPPVLIETAPLPEPVDTEYVTITVREAVNDGYGLYLAVAFTPKEEDTLVLNVSVNPFKDGPETIGLVPDEKNQTIARWAERHGYRRFIRVMLMSMRPEFDAIPKELVDGDEVAAWMEEHDMPFKRDTDGSVIFAQVSESAEFDSYMNRKMLVEEDGTTLVMAAGSSLKGQEEYPLSWSAVPYKINENGTWAWGYSEPQVDMTKWTQGTIPLHIPENSGGTTAVLARYEGTVPSLANPGETVPVTVSMIRTELNDYIQIRCADQGRVFHSAELYTEDRETNLAPADFAISDIHTYSVRDEEGTLVFTYSCLIPDELPDRLVIQWYEAANLSYHETTVIGRIKEE